MPNEGALLRTLEEILAVDGTDVRTSMTRIADLVARAASAEKVDVFLVDAAAEELVAVGTSRTPLGRKQRDLGLDRLSLARGGRAAEVFRTGVRSLQRDAAEDEVERRDVVEELGIRCAVFVPLEVGGVRRGVLALASPRPGAFGEEQLEFTSAVSRWIATELHRAELVEQLAARAKEDGRRAAADEIVMVVAHDFRNFLAPIAGRIALMHKRAERDGRDQDRRDCEAAERSVRGVTRVVEDLLDVARVDQGLVQLQTVPLDLAGLVREVATGLALPDRAVEVHAAPEVVVAADAARVRQIVENVLSNAVKHAPPRTTVRVEVGLDGMNGGPRARVRISDQGPGIAPEVLPHVFERFQRGSGSTGLGLGLYLAHELATAHGGSLSVESEPGRGSTFTLTLPAHA
jgi:two-component system, OmpR family, sensor kinase